VSKSVDTPPSPLTNWAHILAIGRYLIILIHFPK
jgi:hypothetical protein